LEQFPEIGFFPSPIFSRTVYIGRCGGTPEPNCSGRIFFEATESIHPDPASPGQIEINGTPSRLGDSDSSVFGNYVCQTTNPLGVRTWDLECQVTITGGRGAYVNSTGTGFMQRTLQLFPVNSLGVVEVSNWQGSVSFSPNPWKQGVLRVVLVSGPKGIPHSVLSLRNLCVLRVSAVNAFENGTPE